MAKMTLPLKTNAPAYRQKHETPFAKEEAQVSDGVISIKDDRHGSSRLAGTLLQKNSYENKMSVDDCTFSLSVSRYLVNDRSPWATFPGVKGTDSTLLSIPQSTAFTPNSQYTMSTLDQVWRPAYVLVHNQANFLLSLYQPGNA